jgi:putative spermidine/putrescine transport system substrate-binding protein
MVVTGFGGGFQDAARTHLFQPWAAASGTPLRDETYNGEVARIYAMTKAHDVTWDVVMVEAPELARGCEDGVFQRLDPTVIKPGKFIPGGLTECGAGAVGWGVALFYDKARHAQGPATYAELWDTARFPGKRSLRSGPKMTLEIALMADGVAPADVYTVLATKAGQDRAFAKLDGIKPSIIWWKSGAQPLQLVGSGEVAYAVGYVGRTAKAAADGAAYPLEWNTMLYSFDYWAIVAGSPYAKQAVALIDSMTDAKPLLALGQDWAVSPANREAAANPDLLRRHPEMVAAHASEGLFIDTAFWAEHGDELEARFNTWVAR